MTAQDDRIQRNKRRFLFTGQPVSDWPTWMIFKNYATDEGLTKIIIHEFEGVLTIYRGDTVEQTQDGDVTIIRDSILHVDFGSPKVKLEAAMVSPSMKRFETTMTL